MSITRKMLKGMGLTEDQQISTHATREGRQKAKRVAEVSLKFLLTPLREGRLLPSIRKHGAYLFLLTPPREGRLQFCTKLALVLASNCKKRT